MLLIVTPTLGTSPLLAQTIKSIADSACTNFRHVLVVPKSRLHEVADAHAGQEIISEDARFGGGLYGAVNTALATIDGWSEFTYINDDDHLGPGVRDACELLRARSECHIVYGRVGLIWGDRVLPYGLTVCRSPQWLPLVWAAGHPGLYQQGAVIRRRVSDRLAGFDAKFRLTADGDFWRRAAAEGFKFEYVPATTGFFRVRAGQLSNDRQAMRSEADAHRGRPSWAARTGGQALWRYYGWRTVAQRVLSGGPLRMSQMIGTDSAGGRK